MGIYDMLFFHHSDKAIKHWNIEETFDWKDVELQPIPEKMDPKISAKGTMLSTLSTLKAFYQCFVYALSLSASTVRQGELLLSTFTLHRPVRTVNDLSRPL